MSGIIPRSPDLWVYRWHLNKWSSVFTNAQKVHSNAQPSFKTTTYAQACTRHARSLMQTKATAVSPPSLLFSLGQTTNRSNEKREKNSQKQKTRFLFSLPGNSLKFFFIKEK